MNPISDATTIKNYSGAPTDFIPLLQIHAMRSEKRLDDGAYRNLKHPIFTKRPGLQLVNLILPIIAGGALSEQKKLARQCIGKVSPCNHIQSIILAGKRGLIAKSISEKTCTHFCSMAASSERTAELRSERSK